ncbi:hypothetical protein ACJ41O_001039 [Fusarium nematophilum]
MASTTAIPAQTLPRPGALRRRVTCGPAVSDSERTEADTAPRLESIGHQKATRLGLPPLTFRPTALEDEALCLAIAFHLCILGILVFLCIKRKFFIWDPWAYFIIKLLPTILGTITVVHLNATATALSRITPFMLCASEHGQHDGAPAGRSLLSSYFPIPTIADLAKSRTWLLIFVKVISLPAQLIVDLKATILLTEDYENAYVVPWALYALVAVYGLLLVLFATAFFSLSGKVTGLRWDPVSIADQLVLFRHSDFLDRFSGTCIAPREFLNGALGEDTRLRLGYWKKGSAYWHGFGIVENRHQTRQGRSDTLPASAATVTDDSLQGTLICLPLARRPPG